MLPSLLRYIALVVVFVAIPSTSFATSITSPEPDHVAPSFTYRLLNGHALKPSALNGQAYMLWLVASWCSSCQSGSTIVADHLAFLREHGVRVVELRLANDLGGQGPGLQAFQKAVGSRANDPNWFWGEASASQTLALDPKGYADIYYLVDARGRIVEASGNPAASWDTIAHFAKSMVATQ